MVLSASDPLEILAQEPGRWEGVPPLVSMLWAGFSLRLQGRETTASRGAVCFGASCCGCPASPAPALRQLPSAWPVPAPPGRAAPSAPPGADLAPPGKSD